MAFESPKARELLLTALAIALGLALMSPGLDEPYGGFLAFSEAWYSLVALNFETGSLLLPEVSPGHPDFNVPPFFAWLVHAAYQVLPPTEGTARLVAIAGALLTVFVVARVGGGAAALLLATCPAFVLLGRNVQPDSWATALTVLAYLLFRRSTALSGVAFGLAIFCKPTVLMFPAATFLAATFERRGLNWLERRHVAWAAIAIVPTTAWIATQLILHRELFLAGLRHGGGAFELPGLDLASTLLGEAFFAGFPLLWLLVPVALTKWGGDRVDRDAVAVLLLGALTFAVVHYHGYYLVALLPAAAMLAGRLLADRPRLLAGCVVVNVIAATMMVGGHGLGRTAVAELASRSAGATFLISPEIRYGYGTLFRLYGKGAHPETGCFTATADAPLIVIPAPPDAEPTIVTVDRPRALTLFGYGFAELPVNPHKLRWGRLALTRVAGNASGLVSTEPVGLVKAWLPPPGVEVCAAVPGPH